MQATSRGRSPHGRSLRRRKLSNRSADASRSAGYSSGRRIIRPGEGGAMHAPAPLSRRNFLVTSTAALSMASWTSGTARGYTGAEMREKTADGTLVGVSKWDLDTPALCVDLTAFERNIATMRE